MTFATVVLRESREKYEGKAAGEIPEKLLARLWQKRAARQREFRTGGGRRVRVLYPGRPGTAAGPDFRDALLEMEGLGLVRGDVELHVRQQDWYAHGHAADPNYNGVVLHAALETSPETTNLQNRSQAPVISLAGLLDEETDCSSALSPEEENPAGARVWQLLERRGWPRPADGEAFAALLDAAGDARFRAKSAAFAALLREQSAAQTLYEGLLEALGYRANRQPFLKLAHCAPYSALAAEAGGYPPAQRVGVLESRLLRLSGLSPESGAPPAPAGLGYGAPLDAGQWHCFRVRPANHPRRRIAGAARLLARFLARYPARFMDGSSGDMGLVEGLAAVVAGGSPAGLTRALKVDADSGQGPAYIGADRAKDLAVNVVLPFCHALSGGGDDGPARRLYHRFGKLQDNDLVREMAELLAQPHWAKGGKTATTARRQQGLIHLHRQLSG